MFFRLLQFLAQTYFVLVVLPNLVRVAGQERRQFGAVCNFDSFLQNRNESTGGVSVSAGYGKRSERGGG